MVLAPVHWWDVVAGLSPIAVLIAAGLAAWIAYRTLNQRTRADDRSEWWRRTQWALDHAVSGSDPQRIMGMRAATVLAQSELAFTEEVKLFDAAWKSIPAVDDRPEEGDNEGVGNPIEPIQEGRDGA